MMFLGAACQSSSRMVSSPFLASMACRKRHDLPCQQEAQCDVVLVVSAVEHHLSCHSSAWIGLAATHGNAHLAPRVQQSGMPPVGVFSRPTSG